MITQSNSEGWQEIQASTEEETAKSKKTTNRIDLRLAMGDLSKHFNRYEFECGCGCGFATVDVKLIQILETVREHFKSPVTINSGCRCEVHNTAVGGTYRSKHKEGIASDIVVKDVEPKDVYDFLCDHVGNHYCGIGNYRTFTHIDVRQNPARWNGWSVII